jgi:hypothetical protein
MHEQEPPVLSQSLKVSTCPQIEILAVEVADRPKDLATEIVAVYWRQVFGFARELVAVEVEILQAF